MKEPMLSQTLPTCLHYESVKTYGQSWEKETYDKLHSSPDRLELI